MVKSKASSVQPSQAAHQASHWSLVGSFHYATDKSEASAALVIAGFRGFEPFGFGTLPQAAAAPVQIVYPRYTMIGGDFETVRGPWGLRGEVAAFVADNFQHELLRVVEGSSIDAGMALDRKAGHYRIKRGRLRAPGNRTTSRSHAPTTGRGERARRSH